MSKAYRDEQNKLRAEKISGWLCDLPTYISDFNADMAIRNRMSSTLLTYIQRIGVFFDYLSCSEDSALYGTDKREISLSQLDSLKVMDIQKFLRYVGASPKTLNEYLTAINALFEYLYDMDYLSKNIITKVKRASIKRYEREVVRLTDAQAVGFIDAATTGEGLTKKQYDSFKKNGLRDRAVCLTLIRTGLRVSELVGLDIGDINFEDSYFSVIRKGNKKDNVFFDDEVKDAVLEYIESREGKKTPSTPLFISTQGKTKGERITVRQVEHIVKKYSSVGAKGSGSGVSPHKLRATFATAMLSETGNITLVQAQLAHENIQTTSIYIDSSTQDKKNARNILMDRDEKARKLENPLSDLDSKIYND